MVTDAYKVKNVYYTEEELKAFGGDKEKYPLFHIDLTLSEDGKHLQYSTSPTEIV